MKKIIVLFLAAVMVLGLAACSRGGNNPAQESNTFTQTGRKQAASNTDTDRVPPESSTDTAVKEPSQPVFDEGSYNLALECVGQPVEVLYAFIGEPVGEATYAPSCLVEDAEDGMLTYNGFYVWTVRTAESELVHQVGVDQ